MICSIRATRNGPLQRRWAIGIPACRPCFDAAERGRKRAQGRPKKSTGFTPKITRIDGPAAWPSSDAIRRSAESNRGQGMLTAYFDESGIHEDAGVCVVAGYWAKKGPWRVFERNWTATLREFDVPLDKFHAKDAVKRRDSAKLLRQLGSVTAASGIRPVCWAIYPDDFFSLSLNERRFLTGGTWHAEKREFLTTGKVSAPYFVPFQECVKIVTGHTPPADTVNFFFGCDRPAGKYAKELFDYWRRRASLATVPYVARFSPTKFGRVGFPLAKETPPLQVADLLAHLTYLFMIENRHLDLKAVPKEPLLSLVCNRKSDNDMCFRSGPQLREMIAQGVPDFPI